MSRIRRQTTPFQQGTVVYDNGQTFGGHMDYQGFDHCEDIVSPKDNEYLYVAKYDVDGGLLNGRYGDRVFNNYRCDSLGDNYQFTHLDYLPENKSNNAFAVTTLARTNPSKPVVDIPVSLLELGDITQLIRDGGRTLIQKLGSANLKVEFGIMPFASDLVKLSNFYEHLERRRRILERLASPTGYRKTVNLGTYSNSQWRYFFLQSSHIFHDRWVLGNTVQTVKGHARWVYNDTKCPSLDVQRNLAMRATLGLTLDLSTVWEAMPWSWLIDWGSNVGEYFAATRNIVPASVDSCSIMRYTRTTWSADEADWGNGLRRSAFLITNETKERIPVTEITPEAQLPILDGRQLGILASLFVTRRK